MAGSRHTQPHHAPKWRPRYCRRGTCKGHTAKCSQSTQHAHKATTLKPTASTPQPMARSVRSQPGGGRAEVSLGAQQQVDRRPHQRQQRQQRHQRAPADSGGGGPVQSSLRKNAGTGHWAGETVSLCHELRPPRNLDHPGDPRQYDSRCQAEACDLHIHGRRHAMPRAGLKAPKLQKQTPHLCSHLRPSASLLIQKGASSVHSVKSMVVAWTRRLWSNSRTKSTHAVPPVCASRGGRAEMLQRAPGHFCSTAKRTHAMCQDDHLPCA